jgi:glycerate dehydrogenase
MIAGAGVDVFEKELINVDNPILQVNNKEKLALTPHVSWASIEARTLLMEKILTELKIF